MILKKKKKDEEEKKKREEKEKFNSMSKEEQELEIKRKKAEELKLKGNNEIRNKNYDQAFIYYTNALELNPKELALNLNLALVYFEKKDYEKCIKQCNAVIDNTNDHVQKGKAFYRKGLSYKELKQIEKAIECFKSSLNEKEDERIREELRFVEKMKNNKDDEKNNNQEIKNEIITEKN